jgi:hypothetical protein
VAKAIIAGVKPRRLIGENLLAKQFMFNDEQRMIRDFFEKLLSRQ